MYDPDARPEKLRLRDDLFPVFLSGEDGTSVKTMAYYMEPLLDSILHA